MTDGRKKYGDTQV
jgi:hypothetical protein